MSDLIDRQAAIDAIEPTLKSILQGNSFKAINVIDKIRALPPAEPKDYTELKREFLRMASYIDVLLECSDEQKETLIGFISRLAEFMPWTERD